MFIADTESDDEDSHDDSEVSTDWDVSVESSQLDVSSSGEEEENFEEAIDVTTIPQISRLSLTGQ